MATLAEVQASIVIARAAYNKAFESQSYSIGDRQLTRQKIDILANELSRLESQESALQAQANGSNSPASKACWNQCT